MVDYKTLAIQDAEAAGIDPNIFVAQIQQESGFNPNAVSAAGAEGIAQFMPATANGLGINPMNPIQALNAAAQMDARNLKAYGGDWTKTLAAYNAGGGAVNSWVAQYGQNWLSNAYAETRNYVTSILTNAGQQNLLTNPTNNQTTETMSSNQSSSSSGNSILGISKSSFQQFALIVFAGIVILMGVVIIFFSQKKQEA